MRQQHVHPLTARGLEVLACLAKGQFNTEIARELGITEQTVKNDVSAIMRKFRIRDRAQAAIVALKESWIRLDSCGRESEMTMG